MSAVPESAFVEHLRSLDREAFVAFVADLWAASGWETEVEGAVVLARRDGDERRLAVLPPRRLARWRSVRVPGDADRVVSPRRIDDRGDLPRGVPDVPVLDAADLRRRLLYAVAPETGDRLCREHLGVPLRDERWEPTGEGPSPVRAAAAAGAVVALVAALVVLGGAPGLLGGGEAPEADGGNATAAAGGDLDDGLGENATRAQLASATTVSEPENVASGPTVYVGSYDGNVYAVDVASGEQVWTAYDPDLPVFSSPTVVEGTVYVGDHSGTIRAFDAAAGEPLWSYGEPGGVVFSSPTVVDGTVYVGSDDGTVYAVDAGFGVEEWSHAAEEGPIVSSPRVAEVAGNDTLYVGTGSGAVLSLDADDGDRRWAFEAEDGVLASPAVAEVGGNATVYVGDEGGTVYAFDAVDGQERWRFEGDGEPMSASPAVEAVGGNATVYVASREGTVYALDADDGRARWRFQGDDTIVASPAVVDGTTYAVSRNGTIYALDAADGRLEWSASLGRSATWATPTVLDGAAMANASAAPAGGNGTLFVGGDIGRLFAFDAETGRQLWSYDGPQDIVPSSPTVVTDPVAGDSVGSRVRDGTLGHHDRPEDPRTGAAADADPQFEVLRVADRLRVEGGERMTLEAVVANAGGAGTREVEWIVGGERLDAVNLTLGAGESARIEVALTTPLVYSDLEYGVRTPGDRAGDSVTVLAPARIEVTELRASETVTPGEQIAVEAEVANLGNRSGETDVRLTVDEEVADVEVVSLSGGESETVRLTASVAEDAPTEDRQYVLEAADDRREGTVTVTGGGPDLPRVGVLTGAIAALVAGALLRLWRRR